MEQNKTQTNKELIEKLSKLPNRLQKQVHNFVDTLIFQHKDSLENQTLNEAEVEYQTIKKDTEKPELTPKNFQSELYELTGRKEPNEAFRKLVQWYLRAELFRLEFQKNEFETKWKMTFEEFEEKSNDMPNASSMEMEEVYFDWDGVVGSLIDINLMTKKWK